MLMMVMATADRRWQNKANIEGLFFFVFGSNSKYSFDSL